MVHFEKKIQERFMQAPSFREYQPAKFVIKFVDFNKFRCASSYASSFKLFFSISLHSCCVQLSDMILACSNREN